MIIRRNPPEIDLTILRRDAYEAIDIEMRRHKQGWSALDHLHKVALDLVRNEISTNDKARSFVSRSERCNEGSGRDCYRLFRGPRKRGTLV